MSTGRGDNLGSDYDKCHPYFQNMCFIYRLYWLYKQKTSPHLGKHQPVFLQTLHVLKTREGISYQKNDLIIKGEVRFGLSI